MVAQLRTHHSFDGVTRFVWFTASGMSVAMTSCLTYSPIEIAANSLVGIPKKTTARVKRMDFAVQSKFTPAAVNTKVSRRISERLAVKRRGPSLGILRLTTLSATLR
jgi:hypothetical protein